MGGGVTPPSVTMACPGSTIYGAPPTVIATVDQSSTIVFYLDGTYVLSGSGTSASYTPGTSVSVGTHTIEVIASNTNGSDSVSCSWTVNPPVPTVTMHCPDSSVLDPVGTSRNFTVTFSQIATVTIFIDSVQDSTQTVSVTAGETKSFTATPTTIGTHTIQIVATNSTGSESASCSWMVCSLPTVQLVNSCPQLTVNGNSQAFSIVVNPNPECSLNFYLGTTLVETIQVTNTSGNLSSTQIFNSTSSIGYQPIVIEASNAAGKTSVSCDWYGTILVGDDCQVYIDNLNQNIINNIGPISLEFIINAGISIISGELAAAAAQYLYRIGLISSTRIETRAKYIGAIIGGLTGVLFDTTLNGALIVVNYAQLSGLIDNNTPGNVTITVNGSSNEVYFDPSNFA